MSRLLLAVIALVALSGCTSMSDPARSGAEKFGCLLAWPLCEIYDATRGSKTPEEP